MAEKKLGKHTVKMLNPPSIISAASIVGPKEGKGPLGLYFDSILDDEMWGEKTWEKAESKLIREAFAKVVSKAHISPDEVDYIIAGDLLSQCIAVNFGLSESEVPFFGIYGACSTMGEALSLGSIIIDGGYAKKIVCMTSSHFCSAERQFRFPLELGAQRPPTAQWTVTGSGAVMLACEQAGPKITYVTTGRIVDMGINDASNMGAAMAPAAVDTIYTHFIDTGLPHDYYDLIITGDLGEIGGEICVDLLARNNIMISDKYNDCGRLIFNNKKQDTHAGGSGCGCSASVLAGYLYKQMQESKLQRILFVPTGALHSPTSIQQGGTIPCIAHAVSIEVK